MASYYSRRHGGAWMSAVTARLGVDIVGLSPVLVVIDASTRRGEVLRDGYVLGA